MDKVFSKYSIEGKDHNGVKNGQKILMKETAPKAAGVILEATHKLKGSQVPGTLRPTLKKLGRDLISMLMDSLKPKKLTLS